MKLLDFVDYLLDAPKLAQFYRQQRFGLAALAHGLASYRMGATITLDADIRLLTFEETPGRIAVQLDGIAYVDVLEVDLALDLLLAAEPGVVTKLAQANRTVEYALYDA